MKYGKVPYVDKPVSRIVLGTSLPPIQTGLGGGKLLDAMTDLGINCLDTARVYGHSEQTLGRWMKKRGNRERLVILSKGGHPDSNGTKRISEKEIRRDLETSLKALGTDRIDIYVLHRDDPEVPAGSIVEMLNALHREGKICAFGGSNWTHERLEEANDYAEAHGLIPMTVSSPNFSLARQVTDPWGGGCVCISGVDAEAAQSWDREKQMAVFSYSSLGRGFLSGKVRGDDETSGAKVLDAYARKGFDAPENYERLRRCETLAREKGVTVPQLAVAWLFHQGIDEYAVISSSSPERMRDNLAALELELTEAENDYLNLETDEREGVNVPLSPLP